jgi:hypothetical protein
LWGLQRGLIISGKLTRSLNGILAPAYCTNARRTNDNAISHSAYSLGLFRRADPKSYTDRQKGVFTHTPDQFG